MYCLHAFNKLPMILWSKSSFNLEKMFDAYKMLHQVTYFPDSDHKYCIHFSNFLLRFCIIVLFFVVVLLLHVQGFVSYECFWCFPFPFVLFEISMNVQVTRAKMADNAKTGSTSSYVRARLDTSVIHVPVSYYSVHHVMECQSAKWDIADNFIVKYQILLFCYCHMVLINNAATCMFNLFLMSGVTNISV